MRKPSANDVARIAPARTGTGRALKKALRAHVPDTEWAAELRALREEIGVRHRPRRD